MNQIKAKTITSLEVAEMVGKDHKELLRDIRRYSEQLASLAESKIALGEFFQESTYQDSNNQSRPCYNVTLKGCEFIGNKLTGIKGTEFTAKYINRFHEMEDVIQNSILSDLSPELQAIFAHDKKLQIIVSHIDNQDKKITDVDNDLQDFKKDMPILGIEESRITAAVRKKGVHCLGGKNSEAYQDKSVRQKVYTDIYGQLKREFGIDTYKAIKRSQCDIAIVIIEAYELPMALEDEINDLNAQMVMN